MAAYAAGADVCGDDLEIEYQNDPEAIDYGRERFGQRCVFCHGSGGLGAKGPALVKGKFKRGGCNQDIVGNIASGIPGTQMGAFGRSLDFDEILKIVAYLRDEERKHREAGDFK
jgi:mono/diheme cytochrome c family protein